MSDYVCVVQAGQVAEGRRGELDAGLAEIAEATFGGAPSDREFRWISVPEGFGFTAGQPSTTSIVIRSVPVGFPQERRVRFMNEVSELWQRVTGCTANEIVITAMDGPIPI